MNCYYHQDMPAIGLCKSCGRGLCSQCIAEVGEGLACQNRCEQRVGTLNRLIDDNVKIQPTITRVFWRTGKFARLTLAILFLVLGVLLVLNEMHSGRTAALLLGCVFAALGGLDLWNTLRIATPGKSDHPDK